MSISASPDSSTHSVVRRVIAAALLTVAALWLLSALVALGNFAFRYPAFDQYQFYPRYLGLGFPASVFQLENGHRPVLPALVRVAEIQWFAANQRLQLVIGIGLALLTALSIAVVAWRDRAPLASRAAAVLIAVIAVFWLGNARMLMHSNENVSIYFTTSFVVLATLATFAARGPRPFAWLTLACAFALCATFSFGPGMACFAAVFVGTLALRLPWRTLGVPLAFFLLAMLLYLMGMPGDEGVRKSLDLRPLDNLVVLLRWLSAPWVHVWLGAAEPAMETWARGAEASTLIGKGLIASSQAVAWALGGNWFTTSTTAIGAVGVGAWVFLLVDAWRRRQALTTIEFLGLGLSTFGLGSGATISLARLHAFDAVPMQVMADRYLPWSCLFWLGIGLHLFSLFHTRFPHRFSANVIAPAMAFAIAICLVPSHRSSIGWSAAVHRNIQQSAVAAQLGIWDVRRLPHPAEATDSNIERSLALLRDRRLAMFAEPSYAMVAEGWRAPPGTYFTPTTARAFVNRTFKDKAGIRDIAAIEGWVSRIEDRPRDAALAIVDATGKLRGLAIFSFLGVGKAAPRFNLPAKRGFDGYVIEPRPGESLRILVVDPENRQILAEIPLEIPDTSGRPNADDTLSIPHPHQVVAQSSR